MAYQEQLSFTRALLSGMQISSHIARHPGEGISREIDRGLRAMLYNTSAYETLLKNPMNQAQDNTIYRFYDEYFCRYIFMKLPDDDSYFYIGPYLLSPVREQAIRERLSAFTLDEEVFRQILRYYAALPIVEDENLLLVIAGTLGNALWGSPDRYETEYVDYEIPDGAPPGCASFSPISAA